MDTTTDLDIIRKYPNRFTWGKVKQIHDVGPYTVVHHQAEGVESNYHVYVDGRDCSVGSSSLGGALILAIAYKNLESNTANWMARAAAKLLGVKED